MVKIAFYKARQNRATWKDKLIAWYTGGSYSHVELIIGNMMYSASPRDGGVRKKQHIWDDRIWDYVEIKDVEVSKIVAFFKMTKGQKYDWLGILGFVLPTQDREHQWFCSEWVSNILKISGYKPLWNKEPSRISPNRLYKILKGE